MSIVKGDLPSEEGKSKCKLEVKWVCQAERGGREEYARQRQWQQGEAMHNSLVWGKESLEWL